MSEAFEIVEKPSEAPATLLHLKGRLDARAASELLERCAPIRQAGLPLIMNLRDVTFVASSGLGALLALTEEFQERGACLRLSCVSDSVREAIELLNLETYLMLHDSDEDAVKGLAA